MQSSEGECFTSELRVTVLRDWTWISHEPPELFSEDPSQLTVLHNPISLIHGVKK